MMAGPDPLAQDTDPFADRRVYPRVAVAMPAFLQAAGERYSVRLLDLSPAGSKLDCPRSLAIGTVVVLDCGTLRRTAVVRWERGGMIGLRFDEELDEREAMALVDRSEALAARIKASG